MDRNVTYRTILQALLMDFKSAGKSQQQIRNHESVLNKWVVFFNKSLDSPAFELENLDKNVAEFIEGMKYGSKSIASKKYQIGNFHKVYLRLESNVEWPETFPERLQFLMKKANVSIRQVADILGVCRESVSNWFKGKVPRIRYLPQFRKLEQLLNVEEGTLSNIIKDWRIDSIDIRRRAAKTPFSQLQKIRPFHKYRLPFSEWPEIAKEQWILLKEHHTSQKAPVFPRNPKGIWHKHGTVSLRLRLFECFFGFLTLSLEKGGLALERSVCDLRLIYETTADGSLKYYEPYMDFVKSRTICPTYPNGVYTKTLESQLRSMSAFINSKTGLMRNAPYFSGYVSSIGLKWDEICEHAMKRIVALIKNTSFQQLRFPDEPVDFIIKDQHPLRFLVSLVRNLEGALPTTFHRWHDRKLLNMYFVCSFLTAIPLRSRMLCKMSLEKNLYKDQNGKWRVKFDRKDFKNHWSAATNHNYDVPCPAWLHPIIDLYLKNRPLFPGGRVINGQFECGYVIRPCGFLGANRNQTEPIENQTLYQYCILATSVFIPGCIGFGPHAWRHILTTDWLKNNPDGLLIAAELLHDSPETLSKSYQHLLKSDWLLHYNRYSDLHFSIKNEGLDLGCQANFETLRGADQIDNFELLRIEKARNKKK